MKLEEEEVITDSEIKTEPNENELDEEIIPSQTYFYTLVGNIPSNFRSGDLRNYFSTFVEEDKFDCFHFRHRPQIVNIDEDNESSSSASLSPEKVKLCSIVRFSEESFLSSFHKKYHGKFWMDRTGKELQGRCVVQKVKLSSDELLRFTKELKPPRFMPKGNVGTRNAYFLDLINRCLLPPSLIKKLNLEFPRARRYKRYSKVPFNYGTKIEPYFQNESSEDVRTAKGHLISSVSVPSTSGKANEDLKGSKHGPSYSGSANENDSDPNEDDDLCEEWERHESLNNDVTSQERSKERLYEEEIELVWEKGGPGIVWYTDAQYWDAQRGNFDERTADDLDVDMEGYYVPGGGDKDARDLLEMRQSDRFRSGMDNDFSVFKKPSTPQLQNRLRCRSLSPTPRSQSKSKKTTIGEFELHTRGFGRKLMEKQGWKDGRGLGTDSNTGIPEALEGDGQPPQDKRGIGYYGEKIEWGSKGKRPKHSHGSNAFGMDEDDRVVIGTIYDKTKDLDVEEPLGRSNAPTFMKRY